MVPRMLRMAGPEILRHLGQLKVTAQMFVIAMPDVGSLDSDNPVR